VGCPSRLKLLLDTHIWVWTLIDRARLSGEVTREIEAAENEIWLSPISLWEVLVLVEYGLTLVTADERLLGSREFRALANR
jgi:PIN domain nuclease of toxin-antitoxin system